MTLLEVDAIDVSYGADQSAGRALHGVTVTVAEGETLAVIGANGAGKSTLLKTIAGLLRPTAASARASRSRRKDAGSSGRSPSRRTSRSARTADAPAPGTSPPSTTRSRSSPRSGRVVGRISPAASSRPPRSAGR